MRRRNIKTIRQNLQQIGYILLSPCYKNNYTKLDIRCDKGHQYKATWSVFQQGHRCPHCAGKIVSYEDVKSYIEEQGYFLLSKQYKNTCKKLDVRCNKDHQYQVTWASFRQGNRCPICNNGSKKPKYYQIKKYIERQKYFLLSKEYKSAHSKLDIQCNKGHQYQVAWTNFQQGQRCPKCYHNKQKLSCQYIKKYIEKQGYVLLSKEYKGARNKLDIQCNEGHTYQVQWNCFQQGNRCPTCDANSKWNTQKNNTNTTTTWI